MDNHRCRTAARSSARIYTRRSAGALGAQAKGLKIVVHPPKAAPAKVIVAPTFAPTIIHKPDSGVSPSQTRSQTLYPGGTPQPTSSTIKQKLGAKTTDATQSLSLHFPSTPKTPNTITGMVVDSRHTIIENAIIEIRSSDGIPIRATKTNRLGQFISATPLKNGIYEIETEALGHTFAIIKLELKGKIIDPLKIQAES